MDVQRQFEERFATVVRWDGNDPNVTSDRLPSIAPNGKPYVECFVVHGPSENAVADSWFEEAVKLAGEKHDTLFWRIELEAGKQSDGTWAAYARFLAT